MHHGRGGGAGGWELSLSRRADAHARPPSPPPLPPQGEFFSASLCVPRARIYDAVKQLRAAGGSGVLVSPLTYIFDEETPRWRALLKELGVDPADVPK